MPVLERLDVVNVLDLWIHNPNIRETDVRQKTVSAGHHACKDGRLLRNKRGSKGEADDDADVFRSVPDQHF